MSGAASSAERLLGAAGSTRVLVIGDVMVDDYILGRVNRSSPEAPVPVVQAMSRSSGLGGAANVARQLGVFGAAVDLVGCVGDDDAGETLVSLCATSGIGSQGVVTVEGGATTRKQRVIANRHQVARIDWERTDPAAAWVTDRVIAALGDADRPDAVVVSDYAKGFVTPRLMEALTAIAGEWSVPLLVDPKSADLTMYGGVSLVKVNQIEAEEAFARTPGAEPDDSLVTSGRRLMSQLGVSRLVVTLGERGMVVIEGDGEPVELTQTSREVFDVSGAGDTVMAVFALGLAAGEGLADIAVIANRAAGVVVSRTGVAVARPSDLLTVSESGTGKVPLMDIPELTAQVDAWRRQGRRVAFTNGCFDLLHPGHLHLLRRAAGEGDVLVVGVNGDRSVRGLKGPLRPLVGQHQRAELVAAVDCVDAVVIFDEADPARLISAIQPDVLVKGADYRTDEIVGADVVLARGGTVTTVPLLDGWSTSTLVDRIRASENPT